MPCPPPSRGARRAGVAAALLALSLPACSLTPAAVPHLVEAPEAQPLLVETTAGPVRGVAAPGGQAFLNIPFAAPPVGDRRWMPPAEPEPWREPRDATKLGPGCVQNYSPAYHRGEPSTWLVEGEEDCLNLNVYAPAGTGPDAKLPVMVWLYGGGLVLGSNSQYDPSRLAQAQGVIVVTPNYRLGALGFLTHPALRRKAGGAANPGLLDQQAALRWVQANIARFGGNPGQVTLFGESAGSWSTCFQIASPGAAGLFHRAILQSGVCTLENSAIPVTVADEAGQAIAEQLGCTDAREIAECLQRQPAKVMAGTVSRTAGMLGPNTWGAVVGDTVLPLHPARALRDGPFNAVPVINGTNRDEGRLFSVLYRLTGELYTERSYREAVTRLFAAKAPQVLEEYPARNFEDPAAAFSAVMTDGIFACPALALNKALAARVPVFAYEFDDPEALSSLPHVPFALPPLKSYHAGEVVSVFQTRWVLADPADFTPAQRALSDQMQAAWGRFARQGDPNGDGMPPWPRFDPAGDRVQLLHPGGISSRSGLREARRCAFWDRLGF